jgi:hypothetical protein
MSTQREGLLAVLQTTSEFWHVIVRWEDQNGCDAKGTGLICGTHKDADKLAKLTIDKSVPKERRHLVDVEIVSMGVFGKGDYMPLPSDDFVMCKQNAQSIKDSASKGLPCL